MFNSVITVFNYHEQTGQWFPSVISGADLIASNASSHQADGTQNADTVDILINCNADKIVTTSTGSKRYIGPKEYASHATPESFVTFAPEQDFIFDGIWPELTPMNDDDYDDGLYHALNVLHDSVYMISSAAFFSLLPHFELGGR